LLKKKNSPENGEFFDFKNYPISMIFKPNSNIKIINALYNLISFFKIKLGKIVIVKEGKLSKKMESFLILNTCITIFYTYI